MIPLLLAAALLAGADETERGMAALRAERFEEAADLLSRAQPRYDTLVALGVALGRVGRTLEARAVLDRAVALEPRRPEARVELGGLLFLDKDYAGAARQLGPAVAGGGDSYATELLATSLHLAGRSLDALRYWNTLGQPRVGTVHLEGLKHTRDSLVRRELQIDAGELLTARALRAARLRLIETEAFARVSLRPEPRSDGGADLAVALSERHGFGSRSEIVVTALANALRRRAQLRYSNINGTGVAVGATYRWDPARPRQALDLHWPRPFRLPGYLDVEGDHESQRYLVDGRRFTLRQEGVALGFRSVLGPATVSLLGLRLKDRRADLADAPTVRPGLVSAAEAGLEHALVERPRDKLRVTVRLLRADPWFGSALSYTRSTAALSYQHDFGEAADTLLPRSQIAARLFAGRGGAGLPLDAMFTPGAASETAYPLRAHRLRRRGDLGGAPIGPGLVLLNAEWRHRLLDREGFQMSGVLLYDAGRVLDPIEGSARTLHDLGIGLRFGVKDLLILRMDFAHGWVDGKNALSAGLGQAF